MGVDWVLDGGDDVEVEDGEVGDSVDKGVSSLAVSSLLVVTVTATLVVLTHSPVLSWRISPVFGVGDGEALVLTREEKSKFSMKFSLLPSLKDATTQHDPFASPKRQQTSSGSTQMVSSTGSLRSV